VTEAPRRKRKKPVVGLTWDQLDGDGIFNNRQRASIDLCVALLEAASYGDPNARLSMLDFVAGFMLYEAFGRDPAQFEWAVSNHGNHLLELADAIDELCRG
jgi:hypothetical protein